MRFYYTSYWTSTDGETFRLAGVIAANEQALGAHFPDAPSEQEQWDALIRRWNSACKDTAKEEFLRELVVRGNGINEEYDEVREVEATDLQRALKKAYEETRRRHDTVLQLYEEIPVADVRLI